MVSILRTIIYHPPGTSIVGQNNPGQRQHENIQTKSNALPKFKNYLTSTGEGIPALQGKDKFRNFFGDLCYLSDSTSPYLAFVEGKLGAVLAK